MTSAATGRTCGTCTMCCKVFDIPSLAKPEGKWCKHCDIGKGCRIYDTRPDQCRQFVCLWLQDPTLPPEWKPETSKLVMSIWPTTGFIYVQVDPGSPLAWRKEPYFSRLRELSERLLRERRHILVFVKHIATLIMPTGPVPIGPMSPDDGFVVRETFSGGARQYVAERVPGAQRTQAQAGEGPSAQDPARRN